MPKNDIGGFFVSLGLNVDKNSFETGNKLVDTVTTSFSKLIGTARNAAVALAGIAVTSGMVESASYKTAQKIGISTEALDLWKASARIAEVNANGLIGAMGNLTNVMGRIRIDGAGLEQFVKKLGELGIVADKVNIKKMLDMAPDELMTEILRKAQTASAKVKKEIADANKALAQNPNDTSAQKTLKDAKAKQQRISIIVGDNLGDAGRDFFEELNRQGKTIDQLLSEAKNTIFTTAADNQKGANFAVEVNTFKAELESMAKLLGDSIGGELTPYLKDLNNWIQENGPEIKDGIKTIADTVGVILGKVKTRLDTYYDEDARKKRASAVNKNIVGQGGFFSGDYKKLKDDSKDKVAAYYLDYNSLANLALTNPDMEDIKKRVEKIKKQRQEEENERLKIEARSKPTPYTGSDPEHWWREESSNSFKIQDGIMRPDGTVTQVAPDDWVFAARNVGDLARAFIPQSFAPAQASAPSSYTINQTFNISGSNDIPQVIREQAYRGTQDGLLQLMAQSSQRLQLMSGTR